MKVLGFIGISLIMLSIFCGVVGEVVTPIRAPMQSLAHFIMDSVGYIVAVVLVLAFAGPIIYAIVIAVFK